MRMWTSLAAAGLAAVLGTGAAQALTFEGPGFAVAPGATFEVKVTADLAVDSFEVYVTTPASVGFVGIPFDPSDLDDIFVSYFDDTFALLDSDPVTGLLVGARFDAITLASVFTGADPIGMRSLVFEAAPDASGVAVIELLGEYFLGSATSTPIPFETFVTVVFAGEPGEVIPLPATLPLIGAGLAALGLAAARRRGRAA